MIMKTILPRKRITSFLTFSFLIFLFQANLNAQLVIQAEDYTQMSGVQTETTSDIGGGINVGWIDNNDWMEYEVSIPVTGDYEISYRIASQSGGGVINLYDGSTLLHVTALPATGDWQNWTTRAGDSLLSLTAGDYTLKIEAVSGGFNVNWWQLRLANPVDSDKPSVVVISDYSTAVHDVSMTWSKSADATSAVVGYDIVLNGVPSIFTQDTSVQLSKLPPATEMDIDVVAKDIAGNSSDTASVTVETDTIPWEIIWRDEFNVDGDVDRSKWNFQVGGDGWGNEESQYYTDGDNATVSGGNLIIEARKETFGSNDFTSSRLNSSGKGDFLYGRIEVKAKLPRTGGTWPAIWTLPTDWVYGPWPDCGEIDIMEHSATYNYGYVFGTIHTGAYNHEDGTQKSGGIAFDDVTDTYHTYAIEWYPDHIDWYVDDIHIFTFDNEYKSTAEWPYDIPHHVLLNVAIGGGLGGAIDYDGVWPQQMLVDYVRIYDFKLGENDTISPDKPTELSVEPKWSTAHVSWNLSVDNYAIEQYYIYLDGVMVDSTLGSDYRLYNLTPLTEYKVAVQAVDYAGNLSDTASANFSTTEIQGLAVPGRIEAEDFTLMDGIDTEECTDAGGGLNVGWIDTDDWLSYSIDVAEEIEYRAIIRSAAQSSSGTLNILGADDNELTSISLPVTGGWQSWESTASDIFNLSAGIQNIKLVAEKGGFNLNWLEIIDAKDYVGINNVSSEEVLIYPNPVKNFLKIELWPEIKQAEVSITAMDGRLVFSEEYTHSGSPIRIENIDFIPGLYVVKLQVDNDILVRKFTVQ